MERRNTIKHYLSWARYPNATPKHKSVKRLQWRDNLPDLSELEASVLPFGYGRSYGDSCLNDDGVLLDATGLGQFIAFDTENGVLRCEAGVSFTDILDVIVPRGWFLPVSPGTKFVSVGGAIANDVHGKNHHEAGTFGCHVTQFELLRSSGERLICSPDENVDLYRATIGGLGLTGLIVWAEFRLKRIPTPLIHMENIRYSTIEEFFDLSADSEANGFAYTVAWTDCLAQGDQLGRGHFQRGDFYDPPFGMAEEPKPIPSIPVPVNFPSWAINRYTVRAFNALYYYRQPMRKVRRVTHYNPFFYPLDAFTDWYRGYGKKGFLQYQFVMPYQHGDYAAITEIFQRISQSGEGSPLVVFKTFGDKKSPGMLSFPRKGVTLALDFAYRGERTHRLLDELDQIVFANGGAIYPAKDARMSAACFRQSFPNWEDFAQYVDPHFSSSFWRRVTEG